MNQVWETKKLGEVCGFVRGPFGGSLKKQIFVEDGFAVYEQSHAIYNQFDKIRYFINDDKFKEMTRFELKPGNLIMSCSGTMGKIAIVPNGVKQGVINQALLLLRPKKSLLNTFLKYWIESDGFQESLKAYSLGAAIQNVASVKTLKEIQVFLPPIPEQKRIVKTLDKAFTAIDKAKANAEKNLQNNRELFDSYLSNVFDPSTSSGQHNPGDDWEEKNWGDLCNFVRGPFGGSLKKTFFKSEGYVVYEQKHAIHDHFNNLRYFIDEDKFSEMKRFELKSGDIIMSCSGVTLGRVAVVPDKIPRGIINQALLKLTPSKGVSVLFLKYWLRSKMFQDIIIQYSGGAAIPNVPSVKILKEIIISLPPYKEQENIVNNIELVLTETKRLEAIYQQKLNDLEELKNSILKKAFEGGL